MIKMVVDYDDFDGNAVSSTLYFHLSKDDIIEMETSTEGGLSKIIPQLVESQDLAQIMKLFKEVIAAAYGTRDDNDPTAFIKDKDVTERFMKSLAFDALLGVLMTDPEKVTSFITGIVPKDVMALMAENEKTGKTGEQPAWIKENRQPTDTELRNMSPDELREAMRAKMAAPQK